MAAAETRICQNCKTQFVIEPEDFDFYEKIDVPPPAFCPECRMQRRFTFRNERNLYRRQCALTGKQVLSCFSPDSGVMVYDRDIWWSDVWNPLQFGAPYDFSKPFFAQFRALMERVPMPAVFNGLCVRSEYCNHVGELKDCYLVSACMYNEHVAYGSRVNFSKDSFDLFTTSHCELCYEGVSSLKCYATLLSQNVEACSNSFFLYDCKGCSNCFGCVNLRNKQYHIFNQPYSKEEYARRLRELDIGSYQNLKRVRAEFEALKARSIRKFANIVNCRAVTGDNLARVSNCISCFDLVDDVRDSKYMVNGGLKVADCYDSYGMGSTCELLYETVDTGLQASRIISGAVVWGSMDMRYCYNCHSSEHCFGCIGLRGKRYCILNKQYTREEYEEFLPRVIAHMNDMPYVDRVGRAHGFGEFFPTEISPFVYNETIANDYFPLAREQVEQCGFRWRDREPPQQQAAVAVSALPDHIRDAPDEVTNWIIGCGSCNRPFRVLKNELAFLRRFNVSLPRLCFECRHQRRLHQVNFPRLYHRQCMCSSADLAAGAKSAKEAVSAEPRKYKNTAKHFHGSERCSNEFETSYAPERKEIVYCEQCYNAEIA